jgi:hypothetical protein
MADWIVCPHCRLRHSSRPDGVCPRCKRLVGPLEADRPEETVQVRAEPSRPTPPPSAQPTMPDVFDEAAFVRARQQSTADLEPSGNLPLGVRIAGAILLINGVVQLVLGTVESAVADAAVLAGPWLASFDIVVGAVLLSNQAQVWRWARVRVLFGGACLLLLHLALGQAFDASVQVLFCAGLFLLLPREAATWRVPVGAGAAIVALTLALSALAPFVGWSSPVSRLRGRMNGEIGEVRDTLSGSTVGYRINLTPGEWHALRVADAQDEEPAEAKEEGGLVYEASQAVRRPEDMLDVHVFALRAPPGSYFDADKVMTGLVDEARDSLPEFLVTEDDWHRGTGGATRILEGQARVDGRRTAVAVGLKVEGACVFMLVGTAPVRMYDGVRDDLLEVYTSLHSIGC